MKKTTTIDTMTFLQRQAAIWYQAERAADPEPWDGISLSDCLEICVDRVERVMAGEVRWSDASPGDRAVWTGRPRWPEEWIRLRNARLNKAAHYPSPNDVEPGTLRLHSYREQRWWNVYDTVTIAPEQETAHAFSGSRIVEIGDLTRTNMRTGGFFSDETFITMNLYIVPLVSAAHVPWGSVFGSLIVGLKPKMPPLPLDELVLGIASWERPIMIPVRQSFQVAFECLPFDGEPFDLRVHIEGLLSREVA